MFILLPKSNESENGETKSIFLGDSGRAGFWELFFSCNNKMIAWMLKVNYILSRLCKIYFKFILKYLFFYYYYLFAFSAKAYVESESWAHRLRTCSLWLAKALWWEGSQLLQGRQNEATVFLLASVFKRHPLNMVLGIWQWGACWQEVGMPIKDQLISVRWEGVTREGWNQKQRAEATMWWYPEIHWQGQILLFALLKRWFHLNVISN